MSVQFDDAPVSNNTEAASQVQTLHIHRNEVLLPSGDYGTSEYVSQGTDTGVVIVPMTVGGNRLLARSHRDAVQSEMWEVPRSIVQRISAVEAERCLFEATGLQATCRRIGTVSPESNVLSISYGVFEAFVDSATDGLPLLEADESDLRWFSEEELAVYVRDAKLCDALTLASIAMQSIESITTEF